MCVHMRVRVRACVCIPVLLSGRHRLIRRGSYHSNLPVLFLSSLRSDSLCFHLSSSLSSSLLFFSSHGQYVYMYSKPPTYENLQVANYQRCECTPLDCFFSRVDRIESSKEPEPVPSQSGVSDIAACPPSPIADYPSALPSPTPLPLQSGALPACSLDASPCMPVIVLQYFSRYCKIKNVFFILCVCFFSVLFV